MNTLVNRLLLALMIQAVIVVAVFWPRYAAESGQAVTALTQLSAGSIKLIRIDNGEENAATLKRNGDRWVLPELANMQADTDMVNRLLDIATEAAARWPVANTGSARQRFEVAQSLFQRRVSFIAEDGAQATILLGTSPGFRQIHARNAQHNEIYPIMFNAFEAPSSNAAWLAPDALQVRAPLNIVSDSYSLSFDGSKWHSGGGGIPDERELRAVLDTLRNMQIKGIASTAQVAALAVAEADLDFSVQSLAGEVQLEFFKLDDAYFVRSSKHPYFFGSTAYDFDRLAGIDFGLISGSP